MQWAFAFAVMLVALVPYLHKRESGERGYITLQNLKRTAWAFVGCWAVQTAYVHVTGIYDPWMFFTVTNLITATIVLWHPAYKMQSMIGAVLIGQAVIDCGYGLAKNPEALMGYLTTQTNLGWLIMLILAVWNGGIYIRGRGGVYRSPADPRCNKSVVP